MADRYGAKVMKLVTGKRIPDDVAFLRINDNAGNVGHRRLLINILVSEMP